MTHFRRDTIFALVAALACDGTVPVRPTPSSDSLEAGALQDGVASVSVAIPDTRAGDGMVVVYWTSGRAPPIGLIVDPPPPPPAVARTRLFISDDGPDSGFRLVAERADSGLDSTFIGPLTNGVTYSFRAAVYDSAGVRFGLSRPVMTTPGPLADPAVRVPAPQADEPLWLSNLSWSPDGRRLALIKSASGGGPDVFVFDLGQRRFERVTSFATAGGSYRLMGVAWSPDGESLAFSYTPSATFYQIDYRIWRVGVDGTGMQPLSSGRVDADAAWVTPGELVFTRGTYGPPNVPQLYRLTLGVPASETAITSGDTLHAYHPSYSSRTDQIVFSGRSSGRSLYLVSRGGGRVEQVTDDWAPGFLGDIHPAWTPDGDAVLFASNRSGHYEVWSLDTHSDAIRQVTRGLDGGVERFAPRPSPDGSQLAFLELRRADPSSGELGSYQLVVRPLER